MANIHVSWLDPHKTRKMVIVGSRRMVVYDDVCENKITVYDKGIDRPAHLGENMDFDKPATTGFVYRAGDILMPKIEWVEPLRCQAQHFAECIREGKPRLPEPLTARSVVDVLEGLHQPPRFGTYEHMRAESAAELQPHQPVLKHVGIADVQFGISVTVMEPVNLYGCIIGDQSSIGPFVEIQRGAVIGKRCRIQSHAFICDMVTIGDDCFISHGAMFINDPFAMVARLCANVSFGDRRVSGIMFALVQTQPFYP